MKFYVPHSVHLSKSTVLHLRVESLLFFLVNVFNEQELRGNGRLANKILIEM